MSDLPGKPLGDAAHHVEARRDNPENGSSMFTLNKEKLRQAFIDSEEGGPQEPGWVTPFDPVTIDADELHRLIDDALDKGIIERKERAARIAIYPLSISEPEPQVSVYSGDGPTLLGSGVAFAHKEGIDEIEASVEALQTLVDDANDLCDQAEMLRNNDDQMESALEAIAKGVPRDDKWGSATGFMQYVCSVLDDHGFERPEHHPDDFDPPR